MATFRTLAAFIPKKIFAQLNIQSSAISFDGFFIFVQRARIKNIVKTDWQNMMNGTEVNENTESTILLKMTIMNELVM
tara:strand:- start:16314 stop:16547 length:234 start_codon:yes stop_codon:yes gene_type:complete